MENREQEQFKERIMDAARRQAEQSTFEDGRFKTDNLAQEAGINLDDQEQRSRFYDALADMAEPGDKRLEHTAKNNTEFKLGSGS